MKVKKKTGPRNQVDNFKCQRVRLLKQQADTLQNLLAKKLLSTIKKQNQNQQEIQGIKSPQNKNLSKTPTKKSQNNLRKTYQGGFRNSKQKEIQISNNSINAIKLKKNQPSNKKSPIKNSHKLAIEKLKLKQEKNRQYDYSILNYLKQNQPQVIHNTAKNSNEIIYNHYRYKQKQLRDLSKLDINQIYQLIAFHKPQQINSPQQFQQFQNRLFEEGKEFTTNKSLTITNQFILSNYIDIYIERLIEKFNKNVNKNKNGQKEEAVKTYFNSTVDNEPTKKQILELYRHLIQIWNVYQIKLKYCHDIYKSNPENENIIKQIKQLIRNLNKLQILVKKNKNNTQSKDKYNNDKNKQKNKIMIDQQMKHQKPLTKQALIKKLKQIINDFRKIIIKKS